MSPLTPVDYRKTAYTHRAGLYLDKPAATDVLPGTLYFSTDQASLERSDGTTWEPYGTSGQWVDEPFNAANFYASGGMTWTVGAPAIIRNRYAVVGKIMFWSMYISWFSGSNVLGGIASNILNINFPGGYLASGNQVKAIDYTAGITGCPIVGGSYASIAPGYLQILKFDNSNFLLADVPGLIFLVIFEVN